MSSNGHGASLLSALVVEASTADDSWENLGALKNVLRAFGCTFEARNESVGNLWMRTFRFMTDQ